MTGKELMYFERGHSRCFRHLSDTHTHSLLCVYLNLMCEIMMFVNT